MFKLGKRYLWGRASSHKDMLFIVEVIRIVGDNKAELKILWQRSYYGNQTFVDRYYDLYEILKNQDAISPARY